MLTLLVQRDASVTICLGFFLIMLMVMLKSIFMQGVELNLKHVHAVGVYGWSSVCETIVGEWLEDISQNQVLGALIILLTSHSST